MEELIDRVAHASGLDRDRAEKAVAIVLAFLSREAPAGATEELFAAIPGAAEAVAMAPAPESSGGFGAMAAFNELTAAGLQVNEVQALTQQLVAFAKDRAGDETVGRIVAAIPGLEAFV